MIIYEKHEIKNYYIQAYEYYNKTTPLQFTAQEVKAINNQVKEYEKQGLTLEFARELIDWCLDNNCHNLKAMLSAGWIRSFKGRKKTVSEKNMELVERFKEVK